jgi:cytochrome c-type biogenesis protein CcmE
MSENQVNPGTETRRATKRRGPTFFGLIAVLGGFGYLLYGGIGENLVYYMTPTELTERGEAAYTTSVRLGGVVIPGSVNWDADALDLRFRIGDGSTELDVHSTGAPPQMFRDGIEVLVEGQLASSGVFRSTSLMVKHSNEYRAPEEGQRPQDLYRDLLTTEGK